MDWIKTVNNAIGYMEDHLTDRIALEDISKSVNLSVFHFHRAFSMLTEMSPTDYLRKRRLSQAGAELADSDEKVIDINGPAGAWTNFSCRNLRNGDSEVLG